MSPVDVSLIASSFVVFVVDDTKEIREGTAALLSTLGGYEVHTFADPDQAHAAIATVHPAVIVTDFQMPGFRNGIEFMLDVQRFHGIPFIVMSGFDRYMIWKEVSHLYPEGTLGEVEVAKIPVLRKPYNCPTLLALVREKIEAAQAHAAQA